MNTQDKKFTEIYYDIMNERNTEAEKIKKGDIVENRHGARFVVEAISKDYEEVKEFDKTGECASYIKYSKRINENTHWMGVRDKFNDIYVYPYNDDGVRFVETAEANNISQKHNSMMDAYLAVINPVEESAEVCKCDEECEDCKCESEDCKCEKKK
jgi:hypothetical protein